MKEKTIEQLIKEALEKSKIKFNEKLDEPRLHHYRLIIDKIILELKDDLTKIGLETE